MEHILFLFAIRTLLQSRTRTDRTGKHFIQFTSSDKVRVSSLPSRKCRICVNISSLCLLGNRRTSRRMDSRASRPAPHYNRAVGPRCRIIAGANGHKPRVVGSQKGTVNLASFNFTGLAGNEHIKQRAVDTLRKYGLGSCSPPGFYGTLG